jgi:F0F1-type ATP synthase membrane subunit b/b'
VFRWRIVEMARAGRTRAELAGEFDSRDQTIANWIDAASRGKAASEALSSAWREELTQLRRA